MNAADCEQLHALWNGSKPLFELVGQWGAPLTAILEEANAAYKNGNEARCRQIINDEIAHRMGRDEGVAIYLLLKSAIVAYQLPLDLEDPTIQGAIDTYLPCEVTRIGAEAVPPSSLHEVRLYLADSATGKAVAEEIEAWATENTHGGVIHTPPFRLRDLDDTYVMRYEFWSLAEAVHFKLRFSDYVAR